MTTKVLIVNMLSGHWSLVIFAITLNLLHLPRVYGVTFKLEKNCKQHLRIACSIFKISRNVL